MGGYAYKVLVEKTEEIIPLGRPGCKYYILRWTLL
jgi:hypothetical protein